METKTNKEFAQEAIDKALMLCCETEGFCRVGLETPWVNEGIDGGAPASVSSDGRILLWLERDVFDAKEYRPRVGNGLRSPDVRNFINPDDYVHVGYLSLGALKAMVDRNVVKFAEYKMKSDKPYLVSLNDDVYRYKFVFFLYSVMTLLGVKMMKVFAHEKAHDDKGIHYLLFSAKGMRFVLMPTMQGYFYDKVEMITKTDEQSSFDDLCAPDLSDAKANLEAFQRLVIRDNEVCDKAEKEHAAAGKKIWSIPFDIVVRQRKELYVEAPDYATACAIAASMKDSIDFDDFEDYDTECEMQPDDIEEDVCHAELLMHPGEEIILHTKDIKGNYKKVKVCDYKPIHDVD